MKQESTPSSPSHSGLKVTLPATPKSSNGDKGDDSMEQQQQQAATEGTLTTEQQHQQEEENAAQNPVDSESRHDGMDVEQSEEQHFVLAPTPAQLGKAPLQRRLASSGSQDSSSKDMSPTELPMTTNTSYNPVFTGGGGNMDEPPPTSANSKKKQFFKKTKNDDMDT